MKTLFSEPWDGLGLYTQV